MRVLLTGHLGYLGTVMAPILTAAGHDVTGLDNGYFEDSGQSPASYENEAVALGDVDGDGDLDAVMAAGSSNPNKLLLNDGSGNFTDSGQELGGEYYSMDVALGDVDGDGDLDAVFARYVDPNEVWFNDGSGNFTDSGQEIGHSIGGGMHGFYSHGVALGHVASIVAIEHAPSNGTAVVNADNTITYTPNPGFKGYDGFTYTLDGEYGIVFVTVTENSGAGGGGCFTFIVDD